MPPGNLFTLARQCLESTDPQAKCELSERAFRSLEDGLIGFEKVDGADEVQPIGVPGRPPRPRLVAPRELPRRQPGSPAGRAALVHALAHIEFNAINLAWDAVYRFRELPHDFHRDWARVAFEEAYHFRLLCQRLEVLGYRYGDFDAHDGLWEMARRTAHDPLVRMALVPRVLEARGLDVTPGLMERLAKAGEQPLVDVLEIILRDEIGHVEIGTRWFRYLCEQRGLDADTTFAALVREYMKGRVKRPFHYDARRAAGFNAREMEDLEMLAGDGGR
ncbi:MAG TPA: ferritin-like domain-containing protein [Gammaproteobacteria bacterium]|nr:ferritin-like domain-containing protein [Gammaproteobacteria bacterium]